MKKTALFSILPISLLAALAALPAKAQYGTPYDNPFDNPFGTPTLPSAGNPFGVPARPMKMMFTPPGFYDGMSPEEEAFARKVVYSTQFWGPDGPARIVEPCEQEAERKMREDRAGIEAVRRGRISRECPQYVPRVYTDPTGFTVTTDPALSSGSLPYLSPRDIQRAPRGHWR